MKRTSGIFSLLLLGGYFAYQNRFTLVRMLESYGIKVPLFQGNLDETVKSGVAKIAGKTQHTDRQVRKAV